MFNLSKSSLSTYLKVVLDEAYQAHLEQILGSKPYETMHFSIHKMSFFSVIHRLNIATENNDQNTHNLSTLHCSEKIKFINYTERKE